jgi:Mn-containing catalase
MFLRVDKLLTELPTPTKENPNAASALQELLGGKYGEMSTINNYKASTSRISGSSSRSIASSPASRPKK